MSPERDAAGVTVARIISGGQTGADRGGLDAAIELGVPHGGWCPKGRLAEDGVIPVRYQLQETESEISDVRTERNVVDADGTVLFTKGPPTGGSAYTVEVAQARGKPLLRIDLEKTGIDEAAAMLRSWLAGQDVHVLNVAGSRESKCPGLHALVRDILVRGLS
ncbi:MAG: putative molybdenum carrier protein [Armatimonadetes bacterium]|nr:putative molybdenum carrier protein [Armatimonadota bacterium]